VEAFPRGKASPIISPSFDGTSAEAL